MVFGEERLFLIEYPGAPTGIMEFFLRYLGRDQTGIKMKGNFPGVWTADADKVSGPLLLDEDNIYQVAAVDYQNNLIWLNPAFTGQ